MKKILLILSPLFIGCSWKTMDFSNKRGPKVGTCEIVSKFVVYPMECPNGKSYALQTMEVRRCYEVPTIFSGIVEYDHCLEQK